MAPRVPDIPAGTDLTGYSVFITGATAGIGLETARLYLRMNASPVYLGIRNLEKGKQIQQKLLEDKVIKQNNPNADVRLYRLDLASLESVKSFAKGFLAEVKSLDIAVLNAGVVFFNYVPTIDRMETTFQVNYLSNALLASYLVPLLTSTAVSTGKLAHLAFVSSEMQKVGSFGTKTVIPENENIIDWFNDKANHGMDRYNVSKLLLTAYANEIASQVDSRQIVVNSMCPGFVYTSLDDNLPFYAKYLVKGFRYMTAKTPVEGARAVALATLTGPDGSGKFYANGKVSPYVSPI
ncbi:hypothetical protein DRE_00891 [Drechslerella stenobrocha 248]|uniref:Uncharacterized protein n=1 Tax=Drechslerella stenobrocha 248 TaxID=1043628 RepID=W7HZ75_9PEZI|nr:hypothetical protein DRE_00891 [Drechslerella stenobrocha 248]